MEGSGNPFIRHETYPDAKKLFQGTTESVAKVCKDCVFVLDTNALLVPYTISTDSLDKIKDVLQNLIQNSRLIIPDQVAREFVDNRPNKIGELYQQLMRKQAKDLTTKKSSYPLLAGSNEYQKVLKLEGELEELVKEYRKKLGKVIDYLQKWTWDDPVSMIYKELLTEDVIYELPIDGEDGKKKILEELRERHAHKIPPGYKDKSKADEGIGDFLIWKAILSFGKEKNCHVTFVSGDGKPDWWHRSEKQALYPRYELVHEYDCETNGKSFHILRFSQFLDLFEVDKETIEEIQAKEKESAEQRENVEDFSSGTSASSSESSGSST